MKKILEMFNKVKLNVPLLDAIQQVPAYAKFLKDMCTKKKKTNVSKKVFLATNISELLSDPIPVKYKNPGCPTITCTIGHTEISRALLDLGASINLLPLSVYQQLRLRELRPTQATIQLGDRSMKVHKGKSRMSSFSPGISSTQLTLLYLKPNQCETLELRLLSF